MLTASQVIFIVIGVVCVSSAITKIIFWVDEPHHRKEKHR